MCIRTESWYAGYRPWGQKGRSLRKREATFRNDLIRLQVDQPDAQRISEFLQNGGWMPVSFRRTRYANCVSCCATG